MSQHDDFREFEQEIISRLIENGVAELSGMTKDGEVIYHFDMDKMKELEPALYEEMMQETEEALLDLYQKGLVEMEFDENLEARFLLSDEARSKLAEIGFVFPEGEDDEE